MTSTACHPTERMGWRKNSPPSAWAGEKQPTERMDA